MGDRISAPLNEGAGYQIRKRKSDCTGSRPSWVPFQIQTDACDDDGPDPVPLSPRHRSIGERKPIPWWPY